MISGGSNFGILYDDQNILKPPVFTFESFANANIERRSEASAIKFILTDEFDLPAKRIFAETLSSTSQENVEFLEIILKRRPMFTGQKKVGILTQLYHMQKALPVFRKAGFKAEPLFVENILANDNKTKIEEICDY